MQPIIVTAHRLRLIILVQSMMILLNSNDINAGREQFQIQVYLQYIKQPNYAVVGFFPDGKRTLHVIHWKSLKYKKIYEYNNFF